MSSILDALRKSEHDRQVASGQSTSMLYPIEIKPEGKPWHFITLLVVTLIAILAIVLWIEFRPIPTESSINSTQPSNSAIDQPRVISSVTPPENTSLLRNDQPRVISNMPPPENTSLLRNKKNKKEKVVRDFAQKKTEAPIQQTITHAPPPHTESIPNTQITNNKAVAGDDPLKGLPELNIAGYIHNTQTGNLAMINNRLVHEGEEISHGLVLVKILDDKAVFNYNGYVFSR